MPIVIHTDEERIGTAVAGKYRIEQVLGRGGMGTVFRGVHAWTGRRVAVKLLKPMFAQDPQTVTRFLHEARAAASISHPNVVEVLDMGREDDGTVYLVLELLQGESLADHLARRRKITVHDAVELLSPIMDALSAAHARGIVHRDLKPDNVFLSRDGAGRLVPKLLDFGVAKLMEPTSGTVTQTGVVIGTPLYMSPEQAGARRDIGPPADVWSMAVVLYEALTGTLPYEETSTTALVVAILTTPPKPLASRDASLPREVCEVVDRALAREPSARWGSIRELRDALARVAASLPRAPELATAALAHTLPGGTSTDAPTEARVPAGTSSELTPLPAWARDGATAPPPLDAAMVAPVNAASTARAEVPPVAPAAPSAPVVEVAHSIETPMTWSGTAPGSRGRSSMWLVAAAVGVLLVAGIAVGAWALTRGDGSDVGAAGAPVAAPTRAAVPERAPAPAPPAPAPAAVARPTALVPSVAAAPSPPTTTGAPPATPAAGHPGRTPTTGRTALVRRPATTGAMPPVAVPSSGTTSVPARPAQPGQETEPPPADPAATRTSHDRDPRVHTGAPAAARSW